MGAAHAARGPDLRFATDPDYCESYGHDLLTGAAIAPDAYRAKAPNGRAFLRAVDYAPPTEEPDEMYPFFLTTGRVVYHFHTRTKTGRSKALRDAAPDAFIQLNESDARRLGIREGEMLRVTSRRGAAEAPARIGDIEPGTLFMPFHYGYWDDPGRPRAANELTLYEWDPVSKQPHFKYAAVTLEKATAPSLPQPDESKRADAAAEGTGTAEGRMHLADYIVVPRKPNAFGLPRDLQDLWLMVNESTISAAVLLQGARALGDRDLERELSGVETRNERQRTWLLTRIRQAAPQTLTVPTGCARRTVR